MSCFRPLHLAFTDFIIVTLIPKKYNTGNSKTLQKKCVEPLKQSTFLMLHIYTSYTSSWWCGGAGDSAAWRDCVVVGGARYGFFFFFFVCSGHVKKTFR